MLTVEGLKATGMNYVEAQVWEDGNEWLQHTIAWDPHPSGLPPAPSP